MDFPRGKRSGIIRRDRAIHRKDAQIITKTADSEAPMPFTIPQTDPKANYLAHRSEIDSAIEQVLTGGRYILGEQVRAFEREFAAYLGTTHAIGVGSGTDALHLALRACGIGPGDRVFTVSHTAVATVAAIELTGATPVLIDIDPATFTMDANRLEEAVQTHFARRRPTADGSGERAVGGRRSAVIPVHLYGQPADMAAILELARRYDLWVIEDCAQAHGAVVSRQSSVVSDQPSVVSRRSSVVSDRPSAVGGQRVGTLGDIAAFSFYPTKNLGALGDGGAIATSDVALAERVRLLREYGWKERYVSHIAGLNTRLDELQAAILRVKLRYLDEENARRRGLAAEYDRLLGSSGVRTPAVRPHVQHVYHQYVIRAERRDALQAALREQGIGTLIHYPVPVHQQPAYAGRVPLGGGALPHTEHAAKAILSLPMFPELTVEQVAAVAEAIISLV
jgi:dTDP-4-amino-4,6-dideoxygalactose transaminase